MVALIVWILLNEVSAGNGVVAGFATLIERAPEKFDMILSADNPHYASLPGLSVLLGGMWVMNVSYWGFNQYIIQRALAAKSIDEAQKGIAFAAFLKLLMPVIVVLPGIAVYVLGADISGSDEAYHAMTMLPVGIKGLVFAALLAAIVSSLASMTNSISTIFTMDILPKVAPSAADKNPVMVGRLVAVAAMLIAMVAARPLLGNFDQAFQYIQEFTGFFTPGIVVIFLLGMFYPATTATAALVRGYWLQQYYRQLSQYGGRNCAFIDRVGLVFLLCGALAIGISHLRPVAQAGAVDLSEVSFKTSSGFNLAALLVTLVLCAFYITWW